MSPFTPVAWMSMVKTCQCVPCRLLNRGMTESTSVHPLSDMSNQWNLVLTRHEEMMLRLIAEGLTSTQIAKRTSRAPSSIKNALSALYRKMGVQNKTQAALLAQELGLLESERILLEAV